MNLQQLVQELAQRKQEFTQLKEKVNQTCQVLLEASNKTFTPTEKELFEMIVNNLMGISEISENTILSWRTDILKNLLEGDEGFRAQKNAAQTKFTSIEFQSTDDDENLSLSNQLEFFYIAYAGILNMYVNFVRAMEMGRRDEPTIEEVE